MPKCGATWATRRENGLPFHSIPMRPRRDSVAFSSCPSASDEAAARSDVGLQHEAQCRSIDGRPNGVGEPLDEPDDASRTDRAVESRKVVEHRGEHVVPDLQDPENKNTRVSGARELGDPRTQREPVAL